MGTKDDKVMRSFDTGATRDTGEGKLDYEGFLCPNVLLQYAKFMNMNRLQSDGQLRDSDNWQKGIPMEVYRKSLMRHYMEFWHMLRTYGDDPVNRDTQIEFVGAMGGMMFNIMGYLHEWLKVSDMVDFDGDEPTAEMAARQAKIAEDQEEDAGIFGSISGFGYPLSVCGCGCGRDDGECDGMSSVDDDDIDKDIAEFKETFPEMSHIMEHFEKRISDLEKPEEVEMCLCGCGKPQADVEKEIDRDVAAGSLLFEGVQPGEVPLPAWVPVPSVPCTYCGQDRSNHDKYCPYKFVRTLNPTG